MAHTEQDVDRVLADALALMNDSGAHWVKGHFRKTNRQTKEVSYCAVGAIRAVTPTLSLRRRAMKALALVIDGGQYLGPPRADMHPNEARIRIEGWNDREDTGWKDIVRAFKDARLRLKKGEA